MSRTTIKEIKALAIEAGIKMTRSNPKWSTRGYWLRAMPITGDVFIFRDNLSRDRAKLMLLGVIEYNQRNYS